MVLHDFRVGGAERVMLRLAGAFAQRGADVEVVTLRGNGPLRSELPERVGHVVLGGARVGRAVPRLATLLRARRPDAVVATLPHVNVATGLAHRLASSRSRLVLREANDPRFEHAFAGPTGALRALLTRAAYARADAVVALTEGNAAAIEGVLRVPPERVVVIPNPAPAVPAEPAPVDGLPSGAPRLLCVARLSRQKDHRTLLLAFERLLASHPCARLALVGDGPERAALAALADELGVAARVHVAGTVLDMEPWWSWADMCVLASRWEGFPNVLLEALAHGVPVVATDCPSGPREVVGDTGVGVLVPVGDAAAVAAAVARVVADPPDPAAVRSRASVFALDRVVERWWRVLDGGA